MVKTVELTVTNDYSLPPSISTLTPSSTEMYLDCIDTLLTEYAGVSNEHELASLTSSLELKYHKLESSLTSKHKKLMQSSIIKHSSIVATYEDKIRCLQDTKSDDIQKALNKARSEFNDELQDWKTQQQRSLELKLQCSEHELGLKEKMIRSELNAQTEMNHKLQQDLKTIIDEKKAMDLAHREQLEQERIQIAKNITERVKMVATQQIKSDLAVAHNTIEHLKEQNKEQQLSISNAAELSHSLLSEKDTIYQKYREHMEQEQDRMEQERKKISDDITETVRLTLEQQYKSDLAVANSTIKHLREQNKEQQVAISNATDLAKSVSSEKEAITLGIASTDKTVKDLSDQIQPILNMYTGSNEEKGAAGEQTVMNLLLEPKYESAKVFNTSGEAACGDIHFHWNDLRCLIEVKNKKTITVEDMKKFERDVRSCKESNKNINCAIFVSLRSGQYPGRSRELIQLDTINNVPVIYTYTSNLDMLHYSIMCLNNLVKSTKTDSHTMETLMSYYNGYAKHVASSITYFSKLIKNHETNIKSLKKEMNKLTILDEDLASNTEFYQLQEGSDLVIADSDDETDDVSLTTSNDVEETAPLDLTVTGIESSINIVIDYYINHSLKYKANPSISDMVRHFNITTHTLLKKLGGIKSISTKAKDKYLTQMVSDDVVRRLKLYKIENGTYPKRVELIRDYISQRHLTKIGYVLKRKKIMDSIHKHVEERDIKTITPVESIEPRADNVQDIHVESDDPESDNPESDDPE